MRPFVELDGSFVIKSCHLCKRCSAVMVCHEFSRAYPRLKRELSGKIKQLCVFGLTVSPEGVRSMPASSRVTKSLKFMIDDEKSSGNAGIHIAVNTYRKNRPQKLVKPCCCRICPCVVHCCCMQKTRDKISASHSSIWTAS